MPTCSLRIYETLWKYSHTDLLNKSDLIGVSGAIQGPSPADARAKMLIHLVGNRLFTL
jgi:hypothetical protein